MNFIDYQKQISTLSNREIKVRVILPDDYDKGDSYPVVYINDGQDILFDEDIHWGACSLGYADYYRKYNHTLPKIIIVALFCPVDRDERTKLYSPFYKAGDDRAAEICGEGKAYLEWIVNELKPWVDREYRTKPEREFTAISGYSTGALFSTYAIVAAKDTFTRAGIISPAGAIWMDGGLREFFDGQDCSYIKSLYIDSGTDEKGRFTTAEEFLEAANFIHDSFLSCNVDKSVVEYGIYPQAQHTQIYWKLRYPDVLRWLFRDLCV